MIRLAILAIMFLFCIHTVNGQDRYSVKSVSIVGDTLINPYFRITNYQLANTHRVFHVFKSDILLHSFLYYFKDTSSVPTILAHLSLGDTINRYYNSIVVKVVEDDNIASHNPVEEVFLLSYPKQNKAFELTDTSRKEPKPIRKSDILVHGKVTIESYLANGILDYQSRPRNLINSLVEINPVIYGLPFNFSYFKSSERSSYGNSVDNFSFNFNFEQFNQVLNKSIQSESDRFAESKIEEHDFQLSGLARERARLSDRLSSNYYQNKYSANQRLVDIGANDSVFASTQKYRIAKSELDSMTLEIESLKRLDSMRLSYDNFLMDAGRTSSIKSQRLNINNEFGDKHRFKSIKPIFKFFGALKRFQLGQVTPNYNQLILTSVSINGIDVEYNKKAVYFSYTAGTTPVSLYPSHTVSNLQKFNLKAIRLGLGNIERLLFVLTFMKSESVYPALLGIDSSVVRTPFSNHVIGFELKYKFKMMDFGLEMATSESNYSDFGAHNQLFDVKALFNKLNYSNSAFCAYSNFRINKFNTNFKATIKNVGADFVSIGNPYLRQDNIRVEFKVSQPLLKNKINISAILRSDRDNLNGKKPGVSKNLFMSYTMSVNFKRLPKIMVIYSPNIANTYDYYSKKENQTRMDFFQANLSKSKKKGAWMYNLSSYFNYNLSSTPEMSTTVFTSNQLGANFMVNKISNSDLTMSIGLFSVYSSGVSNTKGWGGNIFSSKTIVKDRLALNLNYVLRNGSDQRHSFSIGATSNLPHQFYLSLSNDYMYVSHSFSESQHMLFSRIQLQKKF